MSSQFSVVNYFRETTLAEDFGLTLDGPHAGNTVLSMRTTILLDDELAASLRKAARKKGLSFSAFLAEAGRAALKAQSPAEEEPFKLVVAGGSGPKSGVDLSKTSQLLVADDEERFGK